MRDNSGALFYTDAIAIGIKKAGTDSPTRSFYGGSRPKNCSDCYKKKQTYKPGSVHIECDFYVTLSFI